MKQVLLPTFLFLRIKDRPFHKGEFFTDFYASEKNTDDVKEAARNSVHSKFTKYFRSLYFLLISIANSLFPDRLSATFQVIISIIFAASIAFRSAGNSIAICFIFTKMESNRITNILILEMAIANLLVTISVMPFIALVHNIAIGS